MLDAGRPEDVHLFEQAPFGYLVVAPNGAILRANRTISSYLSMSQKALCTRRLHDLLTAPGQIYLETYVLPILALQGACDEVALDLILESGERLPTLANFVAWRDPTGRVMCTAAAVLKAKDRRRFERELLEARRSVEQKNDELRAANATLADLVARLDGSNRQLRALVHEVDVARRAAEAASQSKGIFLANMSHEIRTPMNGVLGMAEILDGLITAPRQKAMIATIRRSGELLLNLLNDILDMSKIEAGKMVIEAIPFVPADVAQGLEALHRLAAEEKGLELEVFLSTGAAAPRLGDPLRVQQILNNLLSNAIKFTERGQVAVVVTARQGQPLVLEVRDTGIGMTEEQVGRLYNSFEQADEGTTRRFGGTGLGMAIVHRLVDLMGGAIAVRSAPGAGTEIRVTLPLPEAPEVSRAAAAAPGGDALSGVRLLVADDSETNRRVIDEMLKGSGAIMEFAANGAEAFELWTRLITEGAAPDILVLDIAMPVMDGKQALAAIRETERGGAVPAIAVTANAMAHQVRDYRAAGFDAHVLKPLCRAELIEAIRCLLPDRAP